VVIFLFGLEALFTRDASNLHGCDTNPECTVYTRQAYTQPVRVIVYTVHSVQRTVFVILPPTTRGWSPLVDFCEKMENGKWD
jgi:hypothetical protein